MSTKQLIELVDRLEYFNHWRRSGDTEQPHPTQIGLDIDAAIEVIKNKINETQITK